MTMNAIIAVNPQQMQEAQARHLPLTCGKVALVSPEDFDRLSYFKWTAMCSGGIWRAYRKVKRADRKETVYMHRAIMKPPPGMVVDHKDGDGLNNVRGNLRVCTQSENLCNTRVKANKQSDAPKGVTWDAARGKWAADIKLGARRVRLGRFASKEDAIAARLAGERALHGEFARAA